MGSEIGNKQLIYDMAAALKIVDQKSGPSELATEKVQPVFDLAHFTVLATPNAGEGQVVMDDGTLKPINGNPTAQQWLISDIAADLPRFNRMPTVFTGSPLPEAWRFDSLACLLGFDAAGATAFNNKVVNFALYYDDTGGDGSRKIPIVQLFPWVTVVTGRLNYLWTMNGMSNLNSVSQAAVWGGRVPAVPGLGTGRCGLYILLSVQDGSNFPANTVLKTYGMARVSTNGVVPDIG